MQRPPHSAAQRDERSSDQLPRRRATTADFTSAPSKRGASVLCCRAGRQPRQQPTAMRTAASADSLRRENDLIPSRRAAAHVNHSGSHPLRGEDSAADFASTTAPKFGARTCRRARSQQPKSPAVNSPNVAARKCLPPILPTAPDELSRAAPRQSRRAHGAGAAFAIAAVRRAGWVAVRSPRSLRVPRCRVPLGTDGAIRAGPAHDLTYAFIFVLVPVRYLVCRRA